MELVPISKDSVVCLPKKMSQQLGGIGGLCVVLRVTNAIHLIDPSSGQSKYHTDYLLIMNYLLIILMTIYV